MKRPCRSFHDSHGFCMLLVVFVLVALVVAGSACRSTGNAPDVRLPEPYAGVDFGISNAPLTLRRLDRIKVPSVEFQRADHSEVVKFIEEFSVAYEKATGKKGVRYFVRIGKQPNFGPGEPEPTVSFTARDISLLEVIKTVAVIADVDYVVYDEDLLEFREKAEPSP